MNFLRSKTPEMVIKEISINLLAFNLIRRLINAVAAVTSVEPRRISFKKTLDYYLSSHGLLSFDVCQLAKTVVETISRFVLRKQEGRFEPRARKTTGGHNEYRTLALPRRQWKLVQILPDLEDDLDFSPLLQEAFEKLRQRIPHVKGKPIY